MDARPHQSKIDRFLNAVLSELFALAMEKISMKKILDTNTHTENCIEKTPVKAIRKYCLECCLEKPSEVRLCAAKNCHLWPFRMGKNPFHRRTMTDEQKQKLARRLKDD
ncbi:MAG: hypothetical protein H6868_10450 [Rhodospirillales bacterium]|nr:hypothetical protein [Rhodospirillales bacterium]MCB9989731.1 hypothetical protein [Rhodospirillales bacterium]